MNTVIKELVPSKILESSQTTQYTAANVTTIIDKCTVTNYSGSTATVSINLIQKGGSSGNSNLIMKTKSLLAGETYNCPEIIGQVLNDGSFISAIAGTATAINIRICGREVSN